MGYEVDGHILVGSTSGGLIAVKILFVSLHCGTFPPTEIAWFSSPVDNTPKGERGRIITELGLFRERPSKSTGVLAKGRRIQIVRAEMYPDTSGVGVPRWKKQLNRAETRLNHFAMLARSPFLPRLSTFASVISPPPVFHTLQHRMRNLY